MQHKYMIHTFKFVASLATCVLCTILAVTGFRIQTRVPAILFTVLAVVFALTAVSYGSVVTISKDCIRRSFLGLNQKEVSWDNISEIGVVGLKVFGNHKKKYGTRYIYFSPLPLNEEQRFDLALRWPPRDMIYLVYEEERIKAIQTIWSKRVVSYNAGDLFM